MFSQNVHDKAKEAQTSLFTQTAIKANLAQPCNIKSINMRSGAKNTVMNAGGIPKGGLQQHAKNGMRFGGSNAASSASVSVSANASGISSSRSNVVMNAGSKGNMYELNTPSMGMMNANGSVSIQGNQAQSQFMRIADSVNADTRFMRKAMLNVEKTKSSVKNMSNEVSFQMKSFGDNTMKMVDNFRDA